MHSNFQPRFAMRPLRIAFPVLVAVLAFASPKLHAEIIGFEGKSLYSQGSANRYYNGDLGDNTTNSQGWQSGSAHFSNSFNFNSQFNFSYWSGFAYSRVTAGNVPGYENQYAARPGLGSEGSEHYAVIYNAADGDAVITFGAEVQLSTVDLTNTAYNYFSMRDGDAFAKKFGGTSGNDPDFFKLELQGFRGGNLTNKFDFYLADFRAANSADDYIVENWTRVNLASLGTVDSLKFALTSSDVGEFGMNTPSYFAMDRLEFSAVPEPSSLLLLGSLATGSTYRLLSRIRRRRPNV